MGEPDDWEAPNPPDPCDCEDYDVDIMSGRATCWCCRRTWYLTNEELQREAKWQAEAAELFAEEMAKS